MSWTGRLRAYRDELEQAVGHLHTEGATSPCSANVRSELSLLQSDFSRWMWSKNPLEFASGNVRRVEDEQVYLGGDAGRERGGEVAPD